MAATERDWPPLLVVCPHARIDVPKLEGAMPLLDPANKKQTPTKISSFRTQVLLVAVAASRITSRTDDATPQQSFLNTPWFIGMRVAQDGRPLSSACARLDCSKFSMLCDFAPLIDGRVVFSGIYTASISTLGAEWSNLSYCVVLLYGVIYHKSGIFLWHT